MRALCEILPLAQLPKTKDRAAGQLKNIVTTWRNLAKAGCFALVSGRS